MNATLTIGQQVKAQFGKFVILAFREIDGEQYAQVKELKPNGKLGRGEMALPAAKLSPL
jgi:hypothetical protein